jgi:hypothetical protein
MLKNLLRLVKKPFSDKLEFFIGVTGVNKLEEELIGNDFSYLSYGL